MSENENGGGASENTEEVEALTNEELEDVESVEKSAYVNQRTRAEKSEAENKSLKEDLEKAKEAGKEKDPEKKDEDKGLSFSDVAKISTEIKDMTSEELELLNLEAQKLGVEPDKFIKSDAWKAYLGKHRETETEKNKTPNASNRVAVHGNKTYNEVMSDPKAPKEDKQKAYEGLMANKFK